MKEHKAEKRFTDLNSAMQHYFPVTGRQLEPLPPKPVLADFYKSFFKTFTGGPGLLISTAHAGAYVAIAKDGSSSIPKPDLKFPSSKSNCTGLNKWHIISVTWSNKGENLSNCWSNGEKLMTFTTGNIKGFDYNYVGDLGKMSGSKKRT